MDSLNINPLDVLANMGIVVTNLSELIGLVLGIMLCIIIGRAIGTILADIIWPNY